MGHVSTDYGQCELLPASMEDWVAPDHPARFIRELVAHVGLAESGIVWKSSEGRGRTPYEAEVLFSVWLYAYFLGLTASRDVEWNCGDNIGMRWLARGQRPDHTTLWRFFDANKASLKRFYKRMVLVAFKADLIGFAIHALDGTKLRTQVSTRSGWNRKRLDKELERLDGRIASLEKAVEEAQTQGGGADAGLPEKLQSRRELRGCIRQALDALEESGRENHHPLEPEAVVMPCQDVGGRRFGFNAQAVVDGASHLIVAQDVVADNHDFKQLPTMLAEVKETLGTTAAFTVADAGYASSEGLAQASGHGNVVVSLAEPDAAQKPLAACQFRHDPESDTVICPLGEALPYTNSRWSSSKGQDMRVYRCKNRSCPVRDQCSKEPKGRVIELGPNHAHLQRQRDLKDDPEARAALRKRGGIVERAFGFIKQKLGFRRWTVRTLERVGGQWSLLCCAYNIHHLYRLWRNGWSLTQAPGPPQNTDNQITGTPTTDSPPRNRPPARRKTQPTPALETKSLIYAFI